MSGQKNNKALRWFLGVTIFVSFGVGIYSLYEYLRIQKINKLKTSFSREIIFPGKHVRVFISYGKFKN